MVEFCFYFPLKLCRVLAAWNLLVVKTNLMNVLCNAKLKVEKLDPALVLVFFGMVISRR